MLAKAEAIKGPFLGSFQQKLSILFACIGLISLCIVVSCTSDKVAGGDGTETGNALSGIIVDLNGTRIANAKVALIPKDFRPFSADTSKILRTTADSLGLYIFPKVKAESYFTITAETSDKHFKGIQFNVYAGTKNEDTINIPAISVLQTGSVEVSIPEELQKGGYVYIEQTNYAEQVSINSSHVTIDSVPAQLYSKVVFIPSSDPKAGQSLGEQIVVEPGQNTDLDIPSPLAPFSHWQNSRMIFFNVPKGSVSQDTILTNFPLWIRLEDKNLPQGTATGKDIRFVSSSGKILPYTMEIWKPQDRLATAWVLLDTLQTNQTSTTIYMLWNGPEDEALSTDKPFSTQLGNALFYDMRNDGQPQRDGRLFDAIDSNNNLHLYMSGNNQISQIIGPLGNQLTAPTENGFANGKITLPISTQNTWSLATWINPLFDQKDSGTRNLIRLDDSISKMSLYIEFNPLDGDFIGVLRADSQSYQVSLAHKVFWAANEWRQLALVWQNNSLIMYMDGLLRARLDSIAPATPIFNPSYAWIGKIGTNSNFKGNIGMISVLHRPLSPSEIYLSYRSQSPTHQGFFTHYNLR